MIALFVSAFATFILSDEDKRKTLMHAYVQYEPKTLEVVFSF